MTTLYIEEQGAVIGHRGELFYVEKGGVRLAEAPLANVERVVLSGGVQITTQAMSLMLRHAIPAIFVSRRGEFRGRLQPSTHKNAPLRMEQYRCHLDDEFRILLARSIIVGKIRNCYRLVLRQRRSHPQLDLGEETEQLAGEMSASRIAPSVASLMGHEGTAARIYFQAFAKMFLHNLGFSGRNRRPPKDPVNAMLSLGYTLLLGEVLTAVETHGLDPYVGFVHGLDYGRPSLAVDLMEEFRFLVDSMVLTLVNRGEVTAEDFSHHDDGACIMGERARKKFYAHFDERITTAVEHRGKHGSYRAVIGRQVQQLSSLLVGKLDSYEPFEFR